jgi:hypothetical protein
VSNKKEIPPIQFPEYIPMYKKRLSDALTYARGKYSWAEFAKKCGINPMTFSRAVNGSIAKPLDEETIKTIAINSDEPTIDVYEDLMRANGCVLKESSLHAEYSENRKRREDIQNAIMRDLFERGYTLSPIFHTPLEQTDPTLQKSVFGFSRHVCFALSVQGYEPAYWNFSVNTFLGEQTAPNKSLTNESFEDKQERLSNLSEHELFRIIELHEGIFLRDLWEPEAFENTRYSIVLVNKSLFEALIKKLEGISFNNSFSLILLDLDNQKVVEERLLPRRDGKQEKSLFSINSSK